jgi:hypothetical protein
MSPFFTVQMYSTNRTKHWKLVTVRLLYFKQQFSDGGIEAKKSERVVGDLEDKKAILAQGVKELDELRASKVCRMNVHSGECRLLNIAP